MAAQSREATLLYCFTSFLKGDLSNNFATRGSDFFSFSIDSFEINLKNKNYIVHIILPNGLTHMEELSPWTNSQDEIDNFL